MRREKTGNVQASGRLGRILKNSNRRFLLAGAVLSAAILAGGCQGQKYEKIGLGAMESRTGNETESPGRTISDQVMAEKAANETDQTVAGEVSGQSENAYELEGSTVEFGSTRETVLAMESRDETVYVNATDLNVRKAPQTNAQVVTRLNTGAQLRRTGYTAEWSRVIWQEQECYVASRFLTTQIPQVPAPPAAGSAGGDSGAGSAASGTGTQEGAVGLNPDWKYAGYAKISSGQAVLYRAGENRRGKVVCVNAGHGTSGGSSVKTQCHPDGTPKVTGGTTGAGATSAVAVSSGMQFADGTPEAKVTLAMAKALKDRLLARGYDVLMIRESDDVQLDNIARTVIANNMADCHIALHWDSTSSDKGAFYMSVPNVASYRAMEPVASHWQEHHALGDSLIAGLQGAGVKIFSNGKMEMDLTQTSYSTVPSIDIELGDKASDHSAATLDRLAGGLADGVELFFGR